MAGKWLSPWDQVLCPFCFESFHLGDAHLRPLDGVSSDMVADEIMHAHLGTEGGEPPVLPRCIVPPTRNGDFSRYLWNRLRLDNSVMVQHDRVCPHCHCPMPTAVAKGELKSNVIAIIGEKKSGKSNFFATLIHELQRGASMEGSGVVLWQQSSINPRTFRKTLSHELWADRYGRFILGENLDGQNCRAVPPSPVWAQNPDVRTPLIYRLQFDKRHRPMKHKVLKPGASFRCLDLVIYDTAGEDMESGENVRLWMNYLTKAQGLVFLLDPHTFPALSAKLPRTGRSRDAAANGSANGQHNPLSRAGIVIKNVLDLFESHSVIGAEEAVAKPTAFVLTKSDILKPPIVGPESLIHFEAMHNDGVDLDDLQRVSKEVKDLLIGWKEDGLLRQTDNFKNSIFSAVSALGEEPVAKGDDIFELSRLRPRRVLDPLMWMLHELGYMVARNDQR